MRIIVVTFLACVAALAQGQSFLTNREVYDFDPGDVFSSHVLQGTNTWNGPGTYDTDSILSKSWSVDSATVSYISHHFFYQPPAMMGDAPYFSNETITLSYTDLDSAATQFVHPQAYCATVLDSMALGAGLCGTDAWDSWSDTEDTCFEAPGWSSRVVRGCGGPYYSYQTADNIYWKALVRFRKGNVVCGNSIPNSIEEITRSMLPYTIPNPALDRVHVVNARPNAACSLFTADGRLIGNGNLENDELNVSALDPGTYFLRLNGSNGPVRDLRLVKR